MLRTAIATVVVLVSAGAVYAQGDATKGEQVFKKCATCHMVGEGAKTKVGPELNDVLGRTAGTLPGFNYSNAMKEAGAKGLVWTPEILSEYLVKPTDYVKGTKMTFPGLPNKDDIANVIAYLEKYSPNYKPAQ